MRDVLVVDLAGKNTQAVDIWIVQSSEILKTIKFVSPKNKKIPQYIDERCIKSRSGSSQKNINLYCCNCTILWIFQNMCTKSRFSFLLHIEGFNFWLLKYEFYSYTNGRCFGEISATLRKKSQIRDRRVKSFRLVGYKSRFSFLYI